MIITFAFISGVIRGLLRIISGASGKDEDSHRPVEQAPSREGSIDVPRESAQADAQPAGAAHLEVLPPPEPPVEEPAADDSERRRPAELGEALRSRDQDPAVTDDAPPPPSESPRAARESVGPGTQAVSEPRPVIGAQSEEPAPGSETGLSEVSEPPLLLVGPEPPSEEQVSEADETREEPAADQTNVSDLHLRRRARRRRRSA